jgi:hypothetical protein
MKVKLWQTNYEKLLRHYLTEHFMLQKFNGYILERFLTTRKFTKGG